MNFQENVLKEYLKNVYIITGTPCGGKTTISRALSDKKVICDCHLTVDQALMFTEPSRVVFLIKDPSNLVDEYRERWDHQGFNKFLNSASDVESAKKTVSTTLYEMNIGHIEKVKNSPFFWLERTESSTVADTLARVERHLKIE